MSTNSDRILEEVEALEAILLDEIAIEYSESGLPEKITTVVFPSTAHDTNKQYVCVTLEISLVANYPDCEPRVLLKNPRGLDDSTLHSILQAIKEKCLEYLGQPVIYELIELVRESLTESNLPTCQCVICLYGFSNGDSFTKTQCFHYFHSYCLAKHVITTEKHFKEEQDKLPAWQKQTTAFQPNCPVCREPISCDTSELMLASPPKELENAQRFEVTKELKLLQAKMNELFIYQKSKGGIIDEDFEKNKLLLITETVDSPITSNPQFPGPSLPQEPQNMDERKENNTLIHHKKVDNRSNTDNSTR